MKNSTKYKIPQKYHEAIKEIYTDEDGTWVSLNSGYYASRMGGYDECHTIHEDTYHNLMYQIRGIKKANETNETEATKMKNVKMVWGMFKGEKGVVTEQNGKNITIKLKSGWYAGNEIAASTDHVEEVKEQTKVDDTYTLVIARTTTGTKTHIATKYENSTHLFVGCGVVKNSGTRMIGLKGEVNARTITCEKCREKYGL